MFLVFLGRDLGVADRAVGSPVEPFGMLADPRGGGAASTGSRSPARSPAHAPRQPRPAGRSPRRCRVPDAGRSDRLPRHQWRRASPVAGLSVQAVVPALAVATADWMDRREVEDVEAHVAHVRQFADHVGERAVPSRDRRSASVGRVRTRTQRQPPCGPPRPPAPAGGREGRRARRAGPSARARPRRAGALSGNPRPGAAPRAARRADPRRGSPVGALGLRRRLCDQLETLGEFQRDRLASRVLLAELQAPGRKRCRARRAPCRGSWCRASGTVPAQRSLSVDAVGRCGTAKNAVIRGPVADHGTELVVAVPEDVGFDPQHIADMRLTGNRRRRSEA